MKDKNILKKEKDIPTNRRTSRLTVDTCTEKVKQKLKNKAHHLLFLSSIYLSINLSIYLSIEKTKKIILRRKNSVAGTKQMRKC